METKKRNDCEVRRGEEGQLKEENACGRLARDFLRAWCRRREEIRGDPGCLGGGRCRWEGVIRLTQGQREEMAPEVRFHPFPVDCLESSEKEKVAVELKERDRELLAQTSNESGRYENGRVMIDGGVKTRPRGRGERRRVGPEASGRQRRE